MNGKDGVQAVFFFFFGVANEKDKRMMIRVICCRVPAWLGDVKGGSLTGQKRYG